MSRTPAEKTFEEDRAQTNRTLQETIAQADIGSLATRAQAERELQETIAQAWKTFDETRAQAERDCHQPRPRTA